MKKKFLALVLTLAMVLSLVPVGALAAGETTNGDVIVKPAETQAYPDGVDSLNKTAVKAEGENTYEVTLEVKMHETTTTTSQAAATVLVIDVSKSMNNRTCGKREHTHTKYCYTTEKKCTKAEKPDHWKDGFFGPEHISGTNCKWYPSGYFYEIEPTLDCGKEAHTHDSSCYPIAAAKEAAKSFVDTYAGTVNGASRYLSIVVFGTNAYVQLNWTDVSTSEGKASAKSVINDLSVNGGVNGGTNLEQGLAKAKDQLDKADVTSVGFKNVVALTDGAPTFYGEDATGDGSSGSEEINTKTAETAEKLKNVANLYTVCFGAKNKETYWNGPTVGNFLKDSIATDATHAYNADNAGELNKAFEKISQTITSGLSAGTVQDALPDGVSSEAFGEGTTAEWDLNTFDKQTSDEGNTKHYTYTKTYTVTIDPDSVDKELFDTNNYYPLNGLTTLTVTVKENGQDTEKTLNFPIPWAKVSYTVTFNSMGGSDVAPQNVNRGATATTPTAPMKAGFEFKGWYTSATCETAYDFATAVTEDITLYAKWDRTEPIKPTEIKYTINQHFMNAKGNKQTNLAHSDKDQSANKDTALSDLIKDIAKDQTIGKDKYMYVSGKYTTKSESQKDQPIESGSKLTEDTTIDLYYYLDNWKDGDSKTSTEDDSATGGDGIPDCYQVLVNYKSGDTNRGSVGPRTMEVLTIKSNDVYASEGQVVASGSTANATGSRCYFSNWTNDDNQQIANSATLEARTIDAKGGDVYTFTANFGRSSGGSNRPKPPVVEIPDDVPTGLNGKDHYAYVVGYPDGMVYPQKNITRAEVATIFFRLLKDETREANMTKSNGYNDMKDGAWYTCAVSTLSKMGIIKGYEDGSFKPDASISRAEFAAIAARFDPDGDKTPATFSDVSSHWAKDEISIAANHGWIKGYEDGSFKPDQKITRAETMTLVNRVLKRLPETKDDLHKDMKTWPDNQKESAWFYLAVQEATNSHYQKLKKDGTHETWESMRETRDWAALEK